MRMFRRQSAWYTKGFRNSSALRQKLVTMKTMDDLHAAVALHSHHEPFPERALRVPRGKTAGTQRVSLPHGYLESLHDDRPPHPDAEAMHGSGG